MTELMSLMTQNAASSAFSLGDQVIFDAGSKGSIKATITDFTREGQIECTQIGGTRDGHRWIVEPAELSWAVETLNIDLY
jgi:hypothetical protein